MLISLNGGNDEQQINQLSLKFSGKNVYSWQKASVKCNKKVRF